MEIQIPAPAEEILQKLNEHGYEAYIVGGCVRDMILGRQPGDWDITTSALPEQVKGVFRRTIDTGIQHGTVTVMLGNEGYEVTTYRIDGEYTDGRHPDSVSFTPSLLEDLKRRDFTINAMAYNRNTGFVDAFGGTEDLKKGVIRCVGDPMDRFQEDALRILRAIRFSAQLGFAIEEKTFEAVKVIAPNLAKVSRERVQAELTKLLLSDHPERIRLVYETKISDYVSEPFRAVEETGLPEIPVSVPPVRHLRWAAFLRRVGAENAGKVLKSLKLDNDTIYRVKVLTEWLGRQELEPEKAALRRAMSEMGTELFEDLLTMKRCLAKEEADRERLLHITELKNEILRDGDCISLKTLAVTGRDVMEAGVKPGKEVGEALAALLSLVLEKPEKNDREILLSEIRCRQNGNPL